MLARPFKVLDPQAEDASLLTDPGVSVARDFAPRHTTVDADVAWKPENPLTQNICHD
ncbi:MAG: hypothetical protein ACI8V4_003791, partial [Ilumatobacter sp.]